MGKEESLVSPIIAIEKPARFGLLQNLQPPVKASHGRMAVANLFSDGVKGNLELLVHPFYICGLVVGAPRRRPIYVLEAFKCPEIAPRRLYNRKFFEGAHSIFSRSRQVCCSDLAPQLLVSQKAHCRQSPISL